MKDSSAPDRIGRAAVLGAGVMGAAIAAHLANVGIPTLLLDIPPGEPREGDDKNAVVHAGLARARKSKPASFSSSRAPSLVEVGNFDDDLHRLEACDWIVEAVVENLDIKRSLYERIAPHVAPHALLTSNTSGLSAAALSEALPPELRPRFMVTHFFNPPRYLKLLELVRGPDTDDAVVDFFADFCDRVLGKGIVNAKDTPNFIANRVGCFGIFHVLQLMLDEGYTVAEVDKLTGRAIGRPGSATFRTADLVGLDTLAHVAGNLYERLEHDPHRDLFDPPDFMKKLVAEGRLGAKSGDGFYKKVKGADGKSEILMVDPATLEYVPQGKVSRSEERRRPAGAHPWSGAGGRSGRGVPLEDLFGHPPLRRGVHPRDRGRCGERGSGHALGLRLGAGSLRAVGCHGLPLDVRADDGRGPPAPRSGPRALRRRR